MPRSAVPTNSTPRLRVGLVFRIASSVLCLAVVSAVTAAEPTVVVERCSLFDPETGKMLPERTIVIRGTQIVRVAGADEVGDVPADAMRIDGAPQTWVPNERHNLHETALLKELKLREKNWRTTHFY